ncbi:complex I NDUFA9 subunit family protein [Fodinicurvata halophila]|uniref:complex I NDUFA9 subunit family protein n=1 Tax=Fodinicurvata halophila TaxID=1419723 RepID=UPI00363318D8
MAQGTVTIFGGSGFIGRYIVERLADQGWTIRVAVRRPQRAQFLKPLGNVGQIVPIPCDLNSSAAIRSALEGVDAAINLVGIMQESGSQNFSNLQSQGARLIAETAAELGIGAFVQMSAIGASEESGSEYARTKAAGEEAVRKALPDAVILRPSVVFGPEDDFFNRFAVMARLSPSCRLSVADIQGSSRFTWATWPTPPCSPCRSPSATENSTNWADQGSTASGN